IQEQMGNMEWQPGLNMKRGFRPIAFLRDFLHLHPRIQPRLGNGRKPFQLPLLSQHRMYGDAWQEAERQRCNRAGVLDQAIYTYSQASLSATHGSSRHIQPLREGE